MKTHLNTLFITIDGAYIHKDGSAVEIKHEGKIKLRVPLHNLDGIVSFGWDNTCSAALMAACAESNVALSFHSPHGKFLAATNGFTSGNILLRKEQYRRADLEHKSMIIAKNMVAAKLANSRNVILRAVRDHSDKFPQRKEELLRAAEFHAMRIQLLDRLDNLESLRGVEGDCAAAYFSIFPLLLTNHDEAISFNNRSRRPPMDPVNALLSFIYALLMHDCRSALESCGLDSQCGFLHRDRPGRPSLALDLMEEFRAYLADRTALSLLNRQQLNSKDFEYKENGAVLLKENSRKIVLAAWQERKQREINHPFLNEKVTVGLLPHLQARLLARHIRGDLDAYPAFIVQ